MTRALVYSPFDATAQERMAGLFRQCPLGDFFAELDSFAPSNRDERAAYERQYGWALYEAGDYQGARTRLIRALRWSRHGSRDRALIRGLLAESHLRTGHLNAAESCTRRGLAEIPDDDHGHYLRAGHLNMLGRIYRRQGHIVDAVATYRRALELIDLSSPHAAPLSSNLVIALLAQGKPRDADLELLAFQGRGNAPGAAEEWSIVLAEAQVALALDDLERADRVLDRAMQRYGDRFGERIWVMLTEMQAAALRARGDWRRSESLLRSVLDHCEPGGRNGDSVACVARGLAESLEGQGRYEEALEPAHLCIRSGRLEDRLECARAYHLLGRCQAALHQDDAARRAFHSALGLHEGTQFVAEQARLQQTLERLGYSHLAEELRGPLHRQSLGIHAEPGVAASLRAGRTAGERDLLLRALERSGGVIAHAARSLGLSRQAFYKALRRTGLASDTTSKQE